ncbi:MAG: UvrD-helicase domain-containing protein, partial [Candidatus Anammoxibacter sp.]
MNVIPIQDCSEIDLDKHALIEASAGTGKTYTIENLVVRMLLEKDVNIENILLVTFTEKATSELKKRIRENIISALENVGSDNRKAGKLQDSLVNFDSASIYTIHGFCQSILTDFSFEVGQPFELEVTNDDPLYEKLIYEQMRSGWKKQYGDDLPDVLKLSDFPNVNSMKRESGWISNVLDTAKSYNKLRGDCLLPETPSDFNIHQLKQELTKRQSKILDIIGFLDKDYLENSKLYVEYGELTFNAGSRKTRQNDIILPLLEFLRDSSNNEESLLNCFSLFLDKIDKISEKKYYKEEGISCLIPTNWNKKTGSNLEEKCPYLNQLVSFVKDIIDVRHMFSIASIKQLCNDVTRYKMKNGLISFDDMLTHVSTAIDSNNNNHSLERLRTRYKYALVDEFQDTDVIQWKIFREIFLYGKDQLLYLIGDPKQAIYSFRGADIFTYIEARKELQSLADKNKARLYSLETNYRSCQGLIHSFNFLFKQDEWFGEEREGAFNKESGNEKIRYRQTSFPPDEAGVLINNSGKVPFTVVNITGNCNEALKKKLESSIRLAQMRMAEFAAHEIDHIINTEIVKDKKGERPLDYNDICILVRKKKEVPAIERALDELQIPHTYYKKPGLYQSDEALELAYLFRAIEKPNSVSALKKALLTPFFKIDIGDLHKYEDVSPSHIIKRLISKWNEYVLARRWSCLFQSIMQDTGAFLKIREQEGCNADRKLTNYTHILQNLEDIAGDQNMDFSDIINTIENYRLQKTEIEKETDLHKTESDKSNVKIMTIHSSKGLQFPVLFLICGFGSDGNDRFFKYHKNNITFYDIAKSNESKERHKREQQDENRRLYYVALTRTELRVYLPEYKPSKQSAAPIADFIYKSIQALKNEWNDEKRKGSFAVIDIDVNKQTTHEVNKPAAGNNSEIPVPPFPPANFNFHKRMIKIESFSSLSYKSHIKMNENHSVSPIVSYPEIEEEKGDDELEQKSEHADIDIKSVVPELPRGRHVGNMLHEILENIDFRKVAEAKREGSILDYLLKDDKTGRLIRERLTYNCIGDEHIEAVAKIIRNTLVTKIIDVDNDFDLSDLKKCDRVHELEFYFSAGNHEKLVLPENIQFKDGFYTGFIDMVFCYKKRYFIVDWKSNYIANGYSEQDMQRGMDESNYHLKRRIYTTALELWLRQRLGDRFDYKRNMGGAFYMFLRGIGGGDRAGVYYCKPEKLET